MKKLAIIALAGVIICGAAAWFYFQPSKAELEQKRISEIVAKGDSVVMTEFLNGDTALLKLADKYAYDYLSNHSRSSLGLSSVIEANPADKKMNLSFSVIEKVMGTDSLAQILYSDYTFDAYWFANMESGEWWNRKVNTLMYFISDAMKQKMKKLALDANDDPFWMHKYIPREEMVKLLLSNHFDSKKTCMFIPRCCDSALIAEIAENASDSLVVAFEIGHAISKERRYKIARNLPLDAAYNFFLESGVSTKEISKLVSSRISETEGYDLLFYFATDHLTKTQVITEIGNKSTYKLVGNFPNRTTVSIWKFPYDIFAKRVISSVKTMDDYKLAVEFFKQTASSDEEDNWIEVLRKKANI